jgi:hypothetical protein
MRTITIAMMIHLRRDDGRAAADTGGSETGTGDSDVGPCAKVPPPDDAADCGSPTRRFWHIARRGRTGRTIRDIKAKDSMARLHAGPMAAKKRKSARKKRAKKKAYYSGRKERRAKKR